MSGLVLPTLVLDASSAVLEADPAFTADEIRQIRTADASLEVGGEAVLAFGGRSWGVGRRGVARSRWVRASVGAVDRMGGHPAWLWTEEGWLDPVRSRELRAPAALPLRQLVGMMAPLGGRRRRAVKTFAAVIASMRAGHRVVVKISPELLASASKPARGLLLAWTTAVPRTIRDRYSIAVGAMGPGFDLTITDRAIDGSVVIDAEDPPDEGDDLVAYFVRNRLYADDAESVESAAWMFDGDPTAWGEGIAARIREGLPGTTDNDLALLENDPERAVRALTARLRAGASLDAGLTRHLSVVTAATRDPRPFRALGNRSDRARAEAVDQLLGLDFQPTAALVDTLFELQPRTAPLDRWIPSLLGWLAQGLATTNILRALESTLIDWAATNPPTRVSVWSEVVSVLVRLGQDELAMDALIGPVAAQIALDGAGRALVAGWATVPASFRDPKRLDRLVGLLRTVPDGDAATADLFRVLRWREDEAVVVVRAWVGRSEVAPGPRDQLFQFVRGTALVRDWAEALPTAGLPYSPALARHWDEVIESLLALEPSADSARDDLLRLPLAVVARSGLSLVEPVLQAEGPRSLARLASGVAREAGASPVWGLLAVALGDPSDWDEAVVDGTVVEFLEHVGTPAENRVARLAFVRVGANHEQLPIDLARWVVRLVHGGHRSKGAAFLTALATGLRTRMDAVETTAGVVDALLQLDRSHPASLALLQVLSEAGWTRGETRSLLDLVGPDRIPGDLVTRLNRAVW